MAAANGWKNPRSIIRPTVSADLLYWRRFGAAGATDAESIQACRRNQAPDTGELAAVFGTPEVAADYLRFTNGSSGIRTTKPSLATYTLYAVARTVDPNYLNTSVDRGFVAGWAGTPPTRGNALLLYDGDDSRGFGYTDVGGTAVPSVAADPTDWLVYCLRSTGTDLVINNLTSGASGTVAYSAPNTSTEGFSIGDGWGNYQSVEVDVHLTALYDAVHDIDDMAAVLADIRLGLASTSITEGS